MMTAEPCTQHRGRPPSWPCPVPPTASRWGSREKLDLGAGVSGHPFSAPRMKASCSCLRMPGRHLGPDAQVSGQVPLPHPAGAGRVGPTGRGPAGVACQRPHLEPPHLAGRVPTGGQPTLPGWLFPATSRLPLLPAGGQERQAAPRPGPRTALERAGRGLAWSQAPQPLPTGPAPPSTALAAPHLVDTGSPARPAGRGLRLPAVLGLCGHLTGQCWISPLSSNTVW
ncbi:transcription initiation factor TFIID subunit 4-like [Lemur catta]|uniref:transcription initiation factor TFIID subunit 4-like n=1 Tax=Lemur catta TaxID=9447 RepID=UPI001E26B535|nr:transcription initiation factor TFIID subunit 4-like [Lemur catta]